MSVSSVIKHKSIAFKLIFYILVSCSALFFGIFWYNYSFSKKIITEEIRENAKNLTRSTVNKIDSVLFGIEKTPEGIASLLENIPFNRNEIIHMIYAAVKDNPQIYGLTVSFEPYAFDGKSLYFAPYYCRKKDNLELEYLGDESYQYFYLDWYQVPREIQAPVWSEPYFDDILMATYSVPFYTNVNGHRKLTGIVSADISLTWLQKLISQLKIEKSGYGFLISKNGAFVTHPLDELIMNKTIFSEADETNNNQLRLIGKNMLKGESDFISYVDLVNRKQSWLSYAPLSSSGWSLGIVFPREELLLDINKLNRMVLILGFLGFSILFGILFFIAVSITRPLKILARITHDIGKGKLDFDLSAIKSKDEVGILAESFVYMRDSLKKYIGELTETTAVKERMQSELRIAHDIQMEIIPKIFPPFPDIPEFDIYGILEPAKEVGGDFYDFFFMDNERLCFVIGDVSDKGVPASLFMAVTKTMIKTMSKGAASPNEILDRVNREIAHDNGSSMFITIFCGILYVKTGEILYSSAGHMFPLIAHPSGKTEFLKGDIGIAVGVLEKAVYKSSKAYLQPQDIICMYTDGVTEAVNEKQELFGEERLKEGISAVCREPVKGIVVEVFRKVREFSRGMPQSDDITLLTVKYFGAERIADNPAEGETITLNNRPSELPRLTEAFRAFAKNQKISERISHEITLALEEIVANIQAYAYTDKGEYKITVTLSLTGSEFSAKIIDDGRLFDPVNATPAPDINASVEKRRIGGLGLLFVRKLMDKIVYQRINGQNVLIVKKNLNNKNESLDNR